MKEVSNRDLRIPMKPDTDSDQYPDTHSDFMPDSIPI